MAIDSTAATKHHEANFPRAVIGWLTTLAPFVACEADEERMSSDSVDFSRPFDRVGLSGSCAASIEDGNPEP
jgi:hypothetical protein